MSIFPITGHLQPTLCYQGDANSPWYVLSLGGSDSVLYRNTTDFVIHFSAVGFRTQNVCLSQDWTEQNVYAL